MRPSARPQHRRLRRATRAVRRAYYGRKIREIVGADLCRSRAEVSERERRLVADFMKAGHAEPFAPTVVFRTCEEAEAASKSRIRPWPRVTQPAPGIRCGGGASAGILLPVVALLLWVAYLITKGGAR